MIRLWAYILLALLFFGFIAYWSTFAEQFLGHPSQITGWALFASVAFLSLFSFRKRLPFLKILGSASRWFLLHAIGGFLALSLFWLHMGSLWPTGLGDEIMATLFYAVTLSGIIGLFLEKLYPHYLTRSGVECIYERIPGEIAEIRSNAEEVLVKCAEETGSDTLAQHYLETLHWFFQRPRFFLNHAFMGQSAQHWVRHQCQILERYLDEKEREYLKQIFALADYKRKVDFHYVAQRILKGWLLIHLPISVAVITLTFWHLIVVHVYFL